MVLEYFILATICSSIFALLEIQIEGKHGWAENLPSWRVYKPWFKYILGSDKPLTGYHIYLWVLFFIYPHVTFLFSKWTFGKELLLTSFVFFFIYLEDFLWFVFNPHFGLRKFKKRYIPWHKNWLGFIPIQYLIGIPIWLLLFYLGLKLTS